MFLVDTSVWISHLQRPDARLANALNEQSVLMHPFVIGELACGNLKNRRELFETWASLETSPKASDDEALHFLEGHRLRGVGLSLVDIHLLASTALSDGARLWTADRQLMVTAEKLRLGGRPS